MVHPVKCLRGIKKTSIRRAITIIVILYVLGIPSQSIRMCIFSYNVTCCIKRLISKTDDSLVVMFEMYLDCFNIEFNTRHCQSIVCPSTVNETHPTLHFTTEPSTVTTCSLFPLILLTMLGSAIVVVHPVSISAGILSTPST